MAAGLSVGWYVDRGVAVVELAGEMDYSNSAQASSALTDVLASGHRELVVDLTGLEFMDSSGLGALIAGWKGARARGGSLCLVCVRELVLRVLRVTGLTGVFEIHGSREECLSGLAQHRSAAGA